MHMNHSKRKGKSRDNYLSSNSETFPRNVP